MRKTYFLNSYIILFILFVSIGLFSCSSTKKIKYFQDIPDSGVLKTIPAAEYTEPKVQVDDILSIIVQTLDPVASQMISGGNINTPGSTTTGALGGITNSNQAIIGLGQSQPLGGYLVNKEGFIDVPIFGKLKVLGYTTTELTSLINNIALKYYVNPTVTVRFANFKISVTGEVLKPGVYIMPNEKVTVMDALAMAGDLTIFGKRENVLLIRTNSDGTRTPYRINLKSSASMYLPCYYLRQNDVIYVEPGKAKAAATDAAQARNYTILGSILSIIAIYLTRK
ncbi:polysaccharide biosynthesis/export family protein [Mucilaginibacter flavus]|uniref:polysaccharide biosynthesis/export family protein n=1 Tax=Mucilaginibacter flavus TaxID=931504 RepID=UPI0025B52EC9|nr:polysaccharide biosynthesis/export family protein [Mucilaginibacter flavus]MDN3583734.1 polysaccharide biosynthesis/export family protein [Mucilaginibacter flavus]